MADNRLWISTGKALATLSRTGLTGFEVRLGSIGQGLSDKWSLYTRGIVVRRARLQSDVLADRALWITTAKAGAAPNRARPTA